MGTRAVYVHGAGYECKKKQWLTAGSLQVSGRGFSRAHSPPYPPFWGGLRTAVPPKGGGEPGKHTREFDTLVPVLGGKYWVLRER